MLVFGMAVASMAFFGYSAMNLDSGTWNILGHQINQGVGQAFLFVPLTLLTMDRSPGRTPLTPPACSASCATSGRAWGSPSSPP